MKIRALSFALLALHLASCTEAEGDGDSAANSATDTSSDNTDTETNSLFLDPDYVCDFSDVAGTWTGMVDGIGTLQLDLTLSTTAPGAQVIGTSSIFDPEVTCGYDTLCAPDQGGKHLVYTFLTEDGGGCFGGWYHLSPAAPNSLLVEYFEFRDGSGVTLTATLFPE